MHSFPHSQDMKSHNTKKKKINQHHLKDIQTKWHINKKLKTNKNKCKNIKSY